MRYQTPQFIEEETKLFGPLTFKQFVYLIGGVGISFVLYKLLPFLIALIVIIPIVMTSLALAFYKVNERPFIEVMEAAFYFLFSNRLYTYRKIDKPVKQGGENLRVKIAPLIKAGATTSKLKDLAWSLDINEKTNSRIKDDGGIGDSEKI